MKKFLSIVLLLFVSISIVGCNSSKDSEPVLFYTNGDEETVASFSKTLDENGFKDQYKVMHYGSSELAAKLDTEKKDTKADVLAFSLFHMETLNDKYKMFQKLDIDSSNIVDDLKSDYFYPYLAFNGTIFYNTIELKKKNLPVPTSIKDLAKPVYKGSLSFPSLEESTTGWLLIQAILDNYTPEEASKIIAGLKSNAGVHIESSGSTPLKKVESGEVALGFGIKHQAEAKVASGVPIKIVDVKEGNYTLAEAYGLVSDNPKAAEMVKMLSEKGREGMLKYFPTPIYKDEKSDNVSKSFKTKLTKELLDEHIAFFKAAK